jgi:hypothetical protein
MPVVQNGLSAFDIDPVSAVAHLSVASRASALTCNRFLPVVTGFTPSGREAGTSVETRLDRFRPDEPTDDQNGSRH